MMELISVIVPIYKAEQYLNRCVASIANQSYSNLEIILIDDGSPDSCPGICDEWMRRDRRVRVIHQENSGVSVARNAGLDAAKGIYIVQVDSDDYISPNMIEVLYRIVKNYECDVSICGFVKGSEESYSFDRSVQASSEIITAHTALSRIYESSENALQYVVPWAKLYKRELFDGIRYPKGMIFEDIYVTHQILNRCKNIAVVPNKLTYYYQHPSSIMNKEYHVGKLDYLGACKDRIDFFEENGYSDLVEVSYDEYLHCLIWEYSRARDLLANKEVMQNIKKSYRKAYIRGHVSKRYPAETKWFLYSFYLEPEIIIWYWRIKAKLQQIRKW